MFSLHVCMAYLGLVSYMPPFLSLMSYRRPTPRWSNGDFSVWLAAGMQYCSSKDLQSERVLSIIKPS